MSPDGCVGWWVVPASEAMDMESAQARVGRSWKGDQAMMNSEARKRWSEIEQPLAMLLEAERLARRDALLRALQRVYFDATWLEADALADALTDEGLLA